MSNGIVDLDRDLFNSVKADLDSYQGDTSGVSSIVSSGLACLSGELASAVGGGTVTSALSNISNDYGVVSSAITSSISQYDQTEENNQFDMSMFEQGVESTFNQVETSITEGTNLSLEERLDMLNQTIIAWDAIKTELETEFKEKYGKGIECLTPEAFENLMKIFNTLDITRFMDAFHLNFIYTYDGPYLDLEFTGRVVDVIKEYDLLNKFQAYMNGESWEKSGLSSIYGPTGENEFLFRMSEFCYDENFDERYYYDSYDNMDAAFIKKGFAELFHLNDTDEKYNPYKMFDTLDKSVAYARELQMNINSISTQIYNLEQLTKILPYTHVMENADFSNYLSRDYANDKSIPDRLKENLSQEELAVYVYIIDHDGKAKADGYIAAMEDLINQRIGMRKAIEYIESMAANGFDIGDIFTSSGTGFIDGVRNFFKGIGNFFSPDGVISASDYEMMFKVSLLAQGENEFNKNLTAAEREFLSFNYQTWQSIGNMIIPSALAFIPVVGKPLSSGLLFLSIAGNSVESALQQGEVGWKAYLYGCLSGLSEVVFERLMGGIPGLSNLSGSFIKDMVSEGTEEFFQEWVDAGLRFAIFGDPIDVTETMGNSVYAFLQGMLVSGIMQAGTNLAFKIGDEIVYWDSNVPYDTLTEKLAYAQGKGEAVATRLSLNLFNSDSNAYRILRDHFVKVYSKIYGVDYSTAGRMIDLNLQTYDSVEINSRINDMAADPRNEGKTFKQLDSGTRDARVITIDGKTIVTTLTDAEIVQFVNDNNRGANYKFVWQIKLSDGIGIPMNASFIAEVTNPDGSKTLRVIWPKEDGYTLDSKGNAIKQSTTLTKGTKLDRYGNEYGTYVSPMDENGKPYGYNSRALPYDQSQLYSQYEVTCDSLDKETITQAIKNNYPGGLDAFIGDPSLSKYWSGDAETGQFIGETYIGEIAGWFGAPGGGTQIQLPLPVNILIQLGLIKKI